MKKYVLITFLLLMLSQSAFCLILDLIKEAVDWAANQANEIQEQLIQKSMLVQLTQTVAILKQNYDTSVQLYNEMKRLNENPGAFWEDTKQQFLSRLENPADLFWNEVEKKQRELNAKENKKWYEKGIGSYIVDETLGAGLEYAKKNWNFGDKIVEAMNKQDKQIEKILDKLGTNDRASVESARNEIAMLQLETMRQQTAILLRLFELQNKRYEEEIMYRKMVNEKQKLFAQTAKEILQKRAQKTQQEKTTREEKIREILRAISDKELKR